MVLLRVCGGCWRVPRDDVVVVHAADKLLRLVCVRVRGEVLPPGSGGYSSAVTSSKTCYREHFQSTQTCFHLDIFFAAVCDLTRSTALPGSEEQLEATPIITPMTLYLGRPVERALSREEDAPSVFRRQRLLNKHQNFICAQVIGGGVTSTWFEVTPRGVKETIPRSVCCCSGLQDVKHAGGAWL